MQSIMTGAIQTFPKETFTVIVPAYNEEKIIGNALEEVCGFISKNNLNWNVIVSVDGTDKTKEIVSSYSNRFGFVSCLYSADRNGKGAAVRRIIDSINTDYVILMDADKSMAFSTIMKGLHLLGEFDGLVFSRYFKENKIPLVRKVLSRGFNLLVRASLQLNIRDTQTGYKVFKTGPFVAAMKKVGSTNTFFDIALLYYLKKQKIKIKEVESPYVHRKESKFHPFGEVIGQGMSLIAFRVRHSRFYKYVPQQFITLYYRIFKWI